MMRFAFLAAVLASCCGPALAQVSLDEPQPLACVPPTRARQLFSDEKLVPPIRVLRQAALLTGAEAIDIQLCRFKDALVYDVTLLDGEGRVVHRLMSALTGGPLGGHGKP